MVKNQHIYMISNSYVLICACQHLHATAFKTKAWWSLPSATLCGTTALHAEECTVFHAQGAQTMVYFSHAEVAASLLRLSTAAHPLVAKLQSISHKKLSLRSPTPPQEKSTLTTTSKPLPQSYVCVLDIR